MMAQRCREAGIERLEMDLVFYQVDYVGKWETDHLGKKNKGGEFYLNSERQLSSEMPRARVYA